MEKQKLCMAFNNLFGIHHLSQCGKWHILSTPVFEELPYDVFDALVSIINIVYTDSTVASEKLFLLAKDHCNNKKVYVDFFERCATVVRYVGEANNRFVDMCSFNIGMDSDGNIIPFDILFTDDDIG